MSLLYEKLVKENKEIVFTHFSNEDAFILGSYLSAICIKEKYPVVICIEKNGQQVYLQANDNTAMNNMYWIEKKANVVKRFAISSALLSAKLEKTKTTFKQKYGDDSSYAITPGSVPIKVDSVGMVGVVTVSGLDSTADHELITVGMKHLLQLQKEEVI